MLDMGIYFIFPLLAVVFLNWDFILFIVLLPQPFLKTVEIGLIIF